MPGKIQKTYTRGRGKSIAAIGDSLTYNDSYWLVSPALMWPEALASKLRALGAGVRSRNFGVSGHTTTQMLTRISQLYLYDVPAIGVIFGGVNDPGNGISGATTQSNITAMIADLLAAGCPRVIICNTQYLNWSAGGDTLTTPYATYATVRTYQAAAVTAAANPDVVLCDLYGYMRALIGNSYDYNGATVNIVAGDNSWHAAVNNQHLNALGEDIIASAILDTIQDNDWLDILT